METWTDAYADTPRGLDFHAERIYYRIAAVAAERPAGDFYPARLSAFVFRAQQHPPDTKNQARS